jgi:hypothetical protein
VKDEPLTNEKILAIIANLEAAIANAKRLVADLKKAGDQKPDLTKNGSDRFNTVVISP